METNSSRLNESLFIFHKCHHTINRIWALLDAGKENTQFVYDYGNILSNYIKLEYLSMLEEYNKYFLPNRIPEYGQRVIDIRRIVKPIFGRINKWQGLSKFRNNIIAHTWRDESGNMVLPDRHKYGVPQNLVEIKILVDLSGYIWALIKAEFTMEVAEAVEHFTSIKSYESKAFDLQLLNNDILQMAEDVDLACKKCGKSYFLKVDQYLVED